MILHDIQVRVEMAGQDRTPWEAVVVQESDSGHDCVSALPCLTIQCRPLQGKACLISHLNTARTQAQCEFVKILRRHVGLVLSSLSDCLSSHSEAE